MKKADKPTRDGSVERSEVTAKACSKATSQPSVAKRLQNPLIPPAHGSTDELPWWHLVVEAPESRGFSVAGDLNSFSAKATAMLIPVLLTVLILVLLKDYSAPADSGSSNQPVTAGFVAQLPVEEHIDVYNPEPAELAYLATDPIGEPSVQPEETLVVEEMPTVAVEATEDAQPKIDTETEAAPETEVVLETEIAAEAEVAPEPEAAPETESKPKEVTVDGILYSHDRPSAIIGGRVVHVGDMVEDAKVVGITKDTVVFEKPGQRWGRGVQEAVARP